MFQTAKGDNFEVFFSCCFLNDCADFKKPQKQSKKSKSQHIHLFSYDKFHRVLVPKSQHNRFIRVVFFWLCWELRFWDKIRVVFDANLSWAWNRQNTSFFGMSGTFGQILACNSHSAKSFEVHGFAVTISSTCYTTWTNVLVANQASEHLRIWMGYSQLLNIIDNSHTAQSWMCFYAF